MERRTTDDPHPDTGSGLAAINAALPTDELDENGRGLFLVTTLATSISVRPAPGYGTEVTVELPTTRSLLHPMNDADGCGRAAAAS